MANNGYDHIEPSFAPSLLGDERDINSFCNTYLGGGDSCSIFQDGAETSTDKFNTLPVNDWNGEQVELWAKEILQGHGVDPYSVNLQPLTTISGRQLLLLTHTQLRGFLGDYCADLLHQELQNLQYGATGGAGGETQSMSSNCLYDSQEWGTTRLNLVDVDRYLPEEPWPPQLSEGGLDELQESWPSSSLSNDAPCDTQDPWSWDTAGDESQSQPLGGPGAYDAVVDDLQDLGLQEQFVHIKCETQTMNGQESLTSASGDISSASGDYRDASGDFSGRELVLPSSDVLKKIPSKTRKRVRGPKSWEFLMRLLSDSRTNPSLIRWEDRESATFRLAQPNLIAQLWSTRSGQTRNLSYNNFARGLRHHYTTGALQPVMEKQLVYRCGPPAIEYLQQLTSDD